MNNPENASTGENNESIQPTIDLMAMIKELQENQKMLMATIASQQQQLAGQQQQLVQPRHLFQGTPTRGGASGAIPESEENPTPHHNAFQMHAFTPEIHNTSTGTREVNNPVTPGRQQTESSGPGTGFVTMAALEEFMSSRGKTTNVEYDLRPPYPSHVTSTPYPRGYATPVFLQYSGRGNAKLHVNKFLDALGMYNVNEELCMREFSKSLCDKAYTWYSNLKPNSIHSWKEMARVFMAKFFMVEERTTLTDLGREKQTVSGDLIVFVKRFRELTLDCVDTVSEETLVAMCIDGMLEEYRVHLENLRLDTFTQLLEAAKRTSLSVKKRSRDIKVSRGPMIVAAAEGMPESKRTREGYRGGGRNPRGGRGRGGRNDAYEEPPPYPAPMEAILDFLRKAVVDGIIVHPENSNPNPSAIDRANPKYCAYHRRVDHPTADCRSLKWIIHKKQQAGLLVLDGRDTRDVEREPYPIHEEGTRRRVNVVFSEGEELTNGGEDYSMSMVGIPEHSVNMLVSQKKFRTFFDAMGYSEPARRAAVRALAQVSSEFQECLIIPTEESYSPPGITFHEEDYIFDDPDHNRALYLEVIINGRRLRSLVDTGAGVNILPRNVFEALGIPTSRVYATKMKVCGLGDAAKPTYGQVTLEMKVGPLTQLARFYIIEASADFDMILGRPWIHGSRAIASSYHQCVKLKHKGKEITLTASANGVQHGLRLESESGGCPKSDASGSNKRCLEFPKMGSVSLPDEGRLAQQGNRNKATRQRRIDGNVPQDRCERLTLPDGRTAYRL